MPSPSLKIRITVDKDRAERALSQIRGSTDRLSEGLRRIGHYGAAAFAGWKITGLVQDLARMSQGVTLVEARMRLVTNSIEEFNAAQREARRIARETGQEYAEIAQLYARTSLALGDVANKQERVTTLTEAVANSLRISGASAAEAASTTRQFSQALGSGVLRGEEFNAIMENGQRLAKALADGLGLPVGKLRELAQQGLLTTDIVERAIASQADTLRQESERIPRTIEQAMTGATDAVAQAVNRLDQEYGVTRSVVESIDDLAQNADQAIRALASGIQTAAIPATVALTAKVISGTAAVVRSTQAKLAEAAAERAANSSRIAALASSAQYAQAKLAEAQASVAAATGVRRLALTENLLIPAQQRAAAAQQALNAARRAGVGIAGRAAGAIGLLGGPIGLITTALTLGVSAWAAWGDSAESAVEKAKRARQSLQDQVRDIQQRLQDEGEFGAGEIGAVRKYIADLEDRIDIIAQSRSPAAREKLRQMREELERLYQTESQLARRARELNAGLDGATPDNAAALRAELYRKQWDNYIQQFARGRERLKIEMDKLRGLAKQAGISETSDQFIKAANALRAKILKKQPGGTGSSEIQRARIEADTELQRVELQRREDDLRRSLDDRLISITEYYRKKTRIEQQQIDLQINETKQKIGVAESSGNQAEAIRLEVELKRLNIERSDIASRNAREQAQAERDLTAAIARVRDELSSLTGQQGGDQADAVDAKYADLRARLEAEGNTEGVNLVDRLIDTKVASENMARIEAQWRQTLERMRQAQEAVQIQQQAGLITEGDAREQIIALQQQSAQELQWLVPQLEQSANAIGPDAVLRVQAMTLELERMKTVADEMAPVWNEIGGSFGQALEGVIIKANNWRDAMTAIYRQVAQSFVRHLVTEPFQQWVTSQLRMTTIKKTVLQKEVAEEQTASAQKIAVKGSETAASVSMEAAKAGAGAAASQASIPVVGPALALAKMALITAAVMALLGKVQRFATGGYVQGPGTATSDSIPARLSAGEYVIRAAAVKQVGVRMLDAINGGAFEPATRSGVLAFAQGGLVPEPRPASASQGTEQGARQQPVRIVNVLDPAMAGDYLNSSAGEKTILNVLRRNAGAVQQIVG